jgi:hypothetical protein
MHRRSRHAHLVEVAQQGGAVGDAKAAGPLNACRAAHRTGRGQCMRALRARLTAFLKVLQLLEERRQVQNDAVPDDVQLACGRLSGGLRT